MVINLWKYLFLHLAITKFGSLNSDELFISESMYLIFHLIGRCLNQFVFVYFQQKDSFWFSNCITRRIKTQVKHNVKVNAKKVNIWSSQNKCIYSLGIEINYFLKFKLSTNGSTKKVLQFQLITLSSIYNIKLRCCKKSILIEILSQNRKWGLTYAKVPLFAWIFIWFQMKKIAAVYISL